MKFCKKCGEEFLSYSRYNKVCKKCFKKNHKKSMGEIKERREKGEDVYKPYYMRK